MSVSSLTFHVPCFISLHTLDTWDDLDTLDALDGQLKPYNTAHYSLCIGMLLVCCLASLDDGKREEERVTREDMLFRIVVTIEGREQRYNNALDDTVILSFY